MSYSTDQDSISSSTGGRCAPSGTTPRRYQKALELLNDRCGALNIDPEMANTFPRALFDGGEFQFPVQACSLDGERYASWFKYRRTHIYNMPL